jgi:hypothetical protein
VLLVRPTQAPAVKGVMTNDNLAPPRGAMYAGVCRRLPRIYWPPMHVRLLFAHYPDQVRKRDDLSLPSLRHGFEGCEVDMFADLVRTRAVGDVVPAPRDAKEGPRWSAQRSLQQDRLDAVPVGADHRPPRVDSERRKGRPPWLERLDPRSQRLTPRLRRYSPRRDAFVHQSSAGGGTHGASTRGNGSTHRGRD